MDLGADCPDKAVPIYAFTSSPRDKQYPCRSPAFGSWLSKYEWSRVWASLHPLKEKGIHEVRDTQEFSQM